MMMFSLGPASIKDCAVELEPACLILNVYEP